MKKIAMRVIAAVVGVFLFAVLDTYVAIPSFIVANTDLSIQYGLLAFLSCLFGPVVGFVVGFGGHALASHYSGFWWPWVISSGLFGLLTGFGGRYIKLAKRKFTGKSFLVFNVVQFVSNLVCFALLAPTLEILFYNSNAGYVFRQGIVAALSNTATTLVVGSLLCQILSMFISQDRDYEKLKSSKA